MSILTFDMNIDELDIANIKVGQEVSITADAYEGEEFSGIVDKVSVVGTSSQGVTTYPVTVIVNSDNKDKLIPGMNVSASIVIEKVENVLRIPVSALRRGNVVIAKTDSDGVEQKNAVGRIRCKRHKRHKNRTASQTAKKSAVVKQRQSVPQKS
ncbi:MAG: efflux RND transporter periplasmic adaptor subunit [Clostridiales bacterium]|nr:MAG: efflux RND transporter periplasmic adaptor subunit [Clostridiales bacterium]